MKRMLTLLFVALCGWLMSGCEKVLEIDTDVERLLVLNGVPSAGKDLFVNFSYSRFFLDTKISHPVEGARVSIDVNGTTYSPSAVQGSNYLFPYTLQEDDQLSINIVADGQRIGAETYVPRMPDINNLVSRIDTSYALRLGYVAFDLADHGSYKDYYRFVITSHDSGARYNFYTGDYDTIDTVRNQIFICVNRELTQAAAVEPLAGFLYDDLLTQDSLFDGATKRVELMMLITIDTNEVAPFKHDFTLNVETMAADRYRYLTDLTKSNSLMAAFAEPAPVYGNVSGGYGIFAGNARRTFPLDIDLSEIVLPGRN